MQLVQETQRGQISFETVIGLTKYVYSQVPSKGVGWEKVRVGWRVNTFFLSLCRSFCMLPYLHFFHPTCLFGT